ncbi:zinc-dependent peptidase [Thioalkalivibrio sp. ALgr3]|uniref:M90 family metallopeptidase n=1 Tax=Thioalkalivibrio sp. ALgr3 TaxID=1239292 RepID=UPI0003682687
MNLPLPRRLGDWLRSLGRPPRAGDGRRVTLADTEWTDLRRRVPFIRTLNSAEAERLRERIEGLLGSKEFVGIDHEPEPWQCHVIAAYAALPVLELGLEPYRDWHTVLIYPDTFVPDHEWVDEDGIVHRGAMPQAGEAWERGPVILSWNDVFEHGAVVVHEVTHILDGGNGDVNGFPPLPRDRDPAAWTAAFSEAWEWFNTRVDAPGVSEDDLPLDPYAATAPEEFLAVAAEAFFFEPDRLRRDLPAVYEEMAGYFRQQPHRRAAAVATSIPEPRPT